MKRWIALTLTVLLCLSMTACSSIFKILKPDTIASIMNTETAKTEATETIQTEATETAHPTVESQGEPIHTIEVIDALYEVYNCDGDEEEFAIPAVYIDGEACEAVNQTIWSYLYDEIYVHEVKEPYEEYGMTAYDEMSYTYEFCDNLLSIVVSRSYNYSDVTHYDIYNISASEGRILTVAEFLKAYDEMRGTIYSETFYSDVTEIAGAYCWDGWSYFRENNPDDLVMAEEMYGCLDDTTSPENIMQCVPYLGSYGELRFRFVLYVPAGSGKIETLTDMNYPVTQEFLNILYAAG